MPNTPMTNHAGSKLVKLVLIGFGIQLLVIGYIFIQAYEGRKELVASQRAGCERSKLDRSANAQGWRNAEEARKAEGQFKVAAEYARIASGLEIRSGVVCSEAFPKARFIP